MVIYFYHNITKGHKITLVYIIITISILNMDYVLLPCYLLNKTSHLFSYIIYFMCSL